ncbi:hypothetical protein BH11PAT4_BH11PAT4_3960 [soil metagenome]
MQVARSINQREEVMRFLALMRKVLVVSGCAFAMLTAFVHAFPAVYGFSNLRSFTTPSVRALGINQQWRMFTSTVAYALPTKLSLVYASGTTRQVVVRGEQVGFSRSAENRFMESTIWNPQSEVIGGFLQASCKRYAEAGDAVVTATMLQARIQLPTDTYNIPVVQVPVYTQVRQVVCNK